MAFTIWELLFWGVLQALVFAAIAVKLFKNAKLAGPLVLWHSKAGLKWMDRVSKLAPNGWRAYGDLGIILAFGFLGAWYVFRKHKTPQRIILSAISPLLLLAPFLSSFALGSELAISNVLQLPTLALYLGGYSLSLVLLLSQEALKIVMGYVASTPVQAAVAPALPGIDVEGSPFRIPWYGWFAFPILIAVHELSHGILARVENFRVKSTGVVLFGLFPFGAFVEPDEKQLEKGAAHKQLRVYSVGSTGNYLTSFFVLALIIFAVTPLVQSSGFVEQYNSYHDNPEILTMVEDSDFLGKLEQGDKILSINGTQTQSIAHVHNATATLGANSYISIETQRGSFGGYLSEDATIGIAALQDTFKPMPLEVTFIIDFVGFLGVVVFFNFVVGIMNLLPMYPLDGGLMSKVLFGRWFGKRRGALLAKWLTVYVLVLFGINIFPLFFPSF